MDRFERLIATGRLNAINPLLASRLNRSDLGGYNPTPVADPYTNPMNVVGAIQAATSRLDAGRISAGMIGVLTLAAVGFYLWTRKYQS
jgi:hypothetical protein